MRRVRLALVGLGNVGRRFLRLLGQNGATLRERHGLVFSVPIVADSSGVAVREAGFDLRRLVDLKLRRGKLSELEECRPDLTTTAALNSIACDILVEASPVDLEAGQPGLSH